MKDDDANKATNQPITLKNESTPDDAAYPYFLHNHKKKKNMTTYTDSPGNDHPNNSNDDAAFLVSLILDSSLKCKIDPKSMLKLN